MKTWTKMSVMAFVLVALTGCAAFWAAIGVTTGSDGSFSADPTGGIVGMIANYFLPGIGGLGVGGLAALVAHVKGKRYKAAGLSLVRGIKEVFDSYKDDHKFSREEVLSIIKATQQADGTRGTVNQLLSIVTGSKKS